MAESEYRIRWQNHANAFQSPNRAQNLRFSFHTRGFTAERRAKQDDLHDQWSVRIDLAQFGSAHELQPFPEPAILHVEDRRANASAQGLVIEYYNSEAGMRQNFILENSLGGDTITLVFNVQLQDVVMEVNAQEGQVSFLNDVEEVMTYGDLNVFDAVGERLSASFVAVSDNSFAIVAEAKDAVYPVLIDPLSFYKAIAGTQSGSRFGYSVAFADITSAKSDDIVVGAPSYDNGQTDEGAVFVFHGTSSSTPPDSTFDWWADSDQSYCEFGYSLANAGHLNETSTNAYHDLIVGAYTYQTGSYTEGGKVFVWYSNSNGSGLGTSDRTADWTRTEGDEYDEYGFSVATAGDVNGDGYSDIIVGAPYYGSASSGGPGKAYVYHGSSSGLSSSPNWSKTGSANNDEFGYSVASAWNLTGASNSGRPIDSVIIGAPKASSGQSQEGLAYVYEGSTNGLASSGTVIQVDQSGARFGHAVLGAHDLDGFGSDDVLVSAPWYDDDYTNEGKVFGYVGLGAAGVDDESSFWFLGRQTGALLGYSMAAMNLDGGSTDYVFGAPYYDNSEATDGGAAIAFWGTFDNFVELAPGDSGSGWGSAIIVHTSSNAHFGLSVAAGVDSNGSATPGVMGGAPHTTNGAIYIYDWE